MSQSPSSILADGESAIEKNETQAYATLTLRTADIATITETLKGWAQSEEPEGTPHHEAWLRDLRLFVRWTAALEGATDEQGLPYKPEQDPEGSDDDEEPKRIALLLPQWISNVLRMREDTTGRAAAEIAIQDLARIAEQFRQGRGVEQIPQAPVDAGADLADYATELRRQTRAIIPSGEGVGLDELESAIRNAEPQNFNGLKVAALALFGIYRQHAENAVPN